MDKLLFFIIFFAFVACNNNIDEPQPVDNCMLESDYAIIKLITNPTDGYILVADSTGGVDFDCSIALNFKLDSINITDNIIKQAIKVNEKKYKVEQGLLSRNMLVFSNEQIDAQGGINKLMDEKEADVYIKFGKPVYFDNNTMALLQFEYFYAPLCGSSWLYVVANTAENKWVVKNKINICISK